ncbi:MAG: TonB-dependent receptor [Bacteroidetes bacterium]|nr:TonB-dependent receptor [Bacteroidota bacterium]
MKKTIYIFLSIIATLTISFSKAQITSSAINGKITDSKGEVLPGALIQATHNPTGTKYAAMTDAKGIYHLINMNVGGPYSIKISYIGQKNISKEGIFLKLGEDQHLSFKLDEESNQLDEVEVVYNTDDNKKGTGTKISKEQIQQLPTLSRSITDFTKLTPQSSNNSFGGTNFRYNNITLDGAINNDAIGFSPSQGGISGTSNMASSSTRSNPISLDAIEDMAVAIAPYDVKLGNFTGGSINAVTRRGTNILNGSVYGFGRNAGITGPDNSGDHSAMPSSYYDYQTGFRIGLPIIKDKLFFFTNAETTNRREPVFYEAGTSGSFITTAIANQIADSLSSPHFMGSPTNTYNPGAINNYNVYAKSNKFFGRIDYNINDKHQLSFRTNWVGSEASNLESNASQFQFGNYDFIQKNNNLSFVSELKSRFTNRTSNSLILGYTTIHDWREPSGSIFPQIQINNINGTGVAFAGTNREAAVFNMGQRTFEITDNFNLFYGKHNFTFGTHNELYGINYGFINSWNGRIDYNSLSAFLANQPSRMRAYYNLSNNDFNYNRANPVSKFNIYLLSAYAQDEYAILDNLKITAGLRLDYTAIDHNPNLASSFTQPYTDKNYSTTYAHTLPSQIKNNLFGMPVISPRIGFTYDVLKDKKIILRGGSGVFQGRMPFAWMGYAYYNNGTNFGAFDYKNLPAGTHIPINQQSFSSYIPAASYSSTPRTVEIDVFDNNFKMPRVWRSNLAVDIKLPGDVKLTLEGMYTKTLYDVMFQQINLKDSVKYLPYSNGNNQQPVYLSGGSSGGKVNPAYSSVYLITNTNQGQRYSLTASLAKEFKFGLNVTAAYTYGKSWDMANGIRNSPESNWQVNPALNPNALTLQYSNFDIRHRIVSTIGYKKSWNKMLTSYFNVIFTAQSGSPYTYAYISNKVTNNGQQIDLAYIPNTQNDVSLTQYTTNVNGLVQTITPQQQWTALNNYILNDPYLSQHRGQYTQRNAARTPWNNTLDFRFMQDINFYDKKEHKHTLTITWDVINALNLIDKAAGFVYFVPNTLNSTVGFGLTPVGGSTNGLPNTNYATPTTAPYSIDKLNSRWQMQLGVRYTF